MLPGPPYAITRTAIRSAVMHEVYHGAHGVYVRLRQHTMSEVEDVTRPPAGALQDVTDLAIPFRSRREQRRGFEVALNRPLAPDSRPGGIDGNAPVDADHVATGSRKVLQERRRPGAEMDERHTGARRERQGASGVLRHIGAVVVG